MNFKIDIEFKILLIEIRKNEIKINNSMIPIKNKIENLDLYFFVNQGNCEIRNSYDFRNNNEAKILRFLFPILLTNEIDFLLCIFQGDSRIFARRCDVDEEKIGKFCSRIGDRTSRRTRRFQRLHKNEDKSSERNWDKCDSR